MKWLRSYHHFDVVKEGGVAPAALTVRVCDGLSCEMAGAKDLLAKLPTLLGREVRVIAAPCIGRCEQAPAVAVGQNPVANATVDAVIAKVKAKAVQHAPQGFTDLVNYQTSGGYALLKACVSGTYHAESSSKLWRTLACVAWVVRAFQQVANGASCAAKWALV